MILFDATGVGLLVRSHGKHLVTVVPPALQKERNDEEEEWT